MEQRNPNSRLICIAAVASAHGVRGALKLRCFTETPENVTKYGPVFDHDGRELFDLRQIGTYKGGIIVVARGVTDRNAADALRGTELFVPRDRLPPTEDDEFYFEDLIGLTAIGDDGVSFGKVRALMDHGAATVITIMNADGESVEVPFTRQHVPEVNLQTGEVVVRLPREPD